MMNPVLMSIISNRMNGAEPGPVNDDPWNVNDGLVIGTLTHKLKGANLAPSFTIDGQVIGWKRMFERDWPVTFERIKVNILRLKERLGINAIRLIGDPSQFYRMGAIDSAYLTKYCQVIEFCRIHNLYFYATACGWGDWGEDGQSYVHYLDYTEQSIIDNLIAFNQACQAYPNVVAIDQIQEYNGWGKDPVNSPIVRTPEQNANFANSAITQIKAAGVTKPITFSIQPWGSYSTIFNQNESEWIEAASDFHDGHAYLPLTADNIEGIISPVTSTGKPIIFGETAVARSGTLGYSGARLSFIQYLATLIQDPRIHGFFYWCGVEDEPLTGRPEGWLFAWGFMKNDGVTYDQSHEDAFKLITIPEIAA